LNLRHYLEARLADARLSAQRSKSDQNGTAESLRLMVQHEVGPLYKFANPVRPIALESAW
jgi:hypothetical protein